MEYICIGIYFLGIWLAIVVAEAMALVVTLECFISNKKKYQYW